MAISPGVSGDVGRDGLYPFLEATVSSFTPQKDLASFAVQSIAMNDDVPTLTASQVMVQNDQDSSAEAFVPEKTGKQKSYKPVTPADPRPRKRMFFHRNTLPSNGIRNEKPPSLANNRFGRAGKKRCTQCRLRKRKVQPTSSSVLIIV